MCVYLYMELAIHTLSSAVSQRERDSFEFNSIIVLNKSGVQLFEQLYVSLVSTDDKHWYFDWNDEPTEVDGNILCSIALRLITLIVFLFIGILNSIGSPGRKEVAWYFL